MLQLTLMCVSIVDYCARLKIQAYYMFALKVIMFFKAEVVKVNNIHVKWLLSAM